ncbi:MAG: DMT family transporter [Acidimicrobiales bacterium]
MLVAAVLFGTTGTAQQLGPDHATTLGLGALRIAIGAVALWVFARRWPRPGLLLGHHRLVLLGAAGVAGYQLGFFTGTDRSGVALGTVVALGSGPLFSGLIDALWLRRAPSASWWLATALAVSGGTLLVLAGDGSSSFSLVGVLGSLLAGLSYAVYAVAAKVLIDRGVDSTVALAWPFTLGAAVLMGAVLVRMAAGSESMSWAVQPAGLVMLAHLGVATVGLAYFLYGYGLRTLDSSRAVTLTLLEPLTAVVLGVSLLGERLAPFGWVGAALVVAGLAAAGGLFSKDQRGRDQRG